MDLGRTYKVWPWCDVTDSESSLSKEGDGETIGCLPCNPKIISACLRSCSLLWMYSPTGFSSNRVPLRRLPSWSTYSKTAADVKELCCWRTLLENTFKVKSNYEDRRKSFLDCKEDILLFRRRPILIKNFQNL